ncbi:conjugal transfer protein TraL [Bryobacter aggregatus]|uniref:conjugal transfer protein TraL n=1 Tax=Bryobacter aggregatus TaxID=360054 RepID=UPI00068DC7C0|nr:conjugal transfer protein TraL [Bryobacter aggregatus]
MTSSKANGVAWESDIHFSLQGKGGVGKSLVASLLAQYFRHRQKTPLHCIDTDPVNQTFSQYRELAVDRLELLQDGSVDQRAFDGLMEKLLTEQGTFIVDNGASTFIPLWNYMLENNAMGMLRDSKRRLYIHCVITGGQALGDTLSGFARLAQTSDAQNIVLWINEYFGRIEREGKQLHEMPVYQENADRVLGAVVIPRRNQDTFGRDVEDVITRKLTLQEAIDATGFPIMMKQRLKVMQRELFEQLDGLSFF